MKHKVFAIVISLALIMVMVLPGTLAISIAQDSLTGELTPAMETPVTEETPAGDTDPAPVDVPAECTCGAETEVHSETCPLYVAPTSHETPMECTCGAENDVHTESCPLYVAQVAGSSLFERLMACKTLEELFALIDETPEEELMQLSDSEVAEVEAKIAELEPEPLPAVVIDESADEPVISEIIYPTVNFDNVAPFGAPVEG